MKRYWWVNHNQTFEQEIGGGYLWSPKVEANGARSQFYDNMREAAPGDAVLSFANSKIAFIGTVQEFALSAPKPSEFGKVGGNWANEGWLLPVKWAPLQSAVRPKDIIGDLGVLLPTKYSPIRPDTGYGNQKAYLAEVSGSVYERIVQTAPDIRVEDVDSTDAPFDGIINRLEIGIEDLINSDRTLSSTEKEQLIRARKGQGDFRKNLSKVESACRLTGVRNPRLLVASHIKPWRSCESAQERLDGCNGLLLAPHVDLLFDRGLIGFADAGEVLISPRFDSDDILKLGLSDAVRRSSGAFHSRQKSYLAYHRDVVFLKR